MKTSLQEKVETSLPEGFTVRGARWKMLNLRSNCSTHGHNLSSRRMRSRMCKPSATNGFLRVSIPPDRYSSGLRTEWRNGWLHRSLDDRQTTCPPVDSGDVSIPIMKAWASAHGCCNGREERALQALGNAPEDLRFAPRGWHLSARQKNPRSCSKIWAIAYIRSSYHMLIEMDGLSLNRSGRKGLLSAPITRRPMRKQSIARMIRLVPRSFWVCGRTIRRRLQTIQTFPARIRRL